MPELMFWRSWGLLSDAQKAYAGEEFRWLISKHGNSLCAYDVDRAGVVCRARALNSVPIDDDHFVLNLPISISVDDDYDFPRVAYIGQEYDEVALVVEQHEGKLPTISGGNAPLGQMTRETAAFWAEAFRVAAWIASRWEVQ